MSELINKQDLYKELAKLQKISDQLRSVLDDLEYILSKATESEELLERPIENLELSLRSYNVLDKYNIKTIGQLVKLTEHDLLKLSNFGKTSLIDVTDRLKNVDLTLGMDV